MCGISVLVSSGSRAIDLNAEVQKMNDAIHHRGPDSEGIFEYENVALGHRRLSIIDLTLNASQPMTKKEITISYNGEIYNYLELKKELVQLGYDFTSKSDTEVIIYSYMEWGLDCFNKFNGMWAIALLDKNLSKIILCRDNFGIKPIFYGYNSDFFYAGSEIKQFFHLHGKCKLNIKQSVNYLNSGLLNYNEETFIDGIYELKAGYFLEIDIYSLEFKKVKWYKPIVNMIQQDYNLCKDTVQKLLKNSVNIRMRSDVNVGACLSGGIDSSCLVSIISQEHLKQENKFLTFTSYYDEIEANELEYSNEVVKSFNLSNIKINPNLDNVIDDGIIDKIVYYHEQPFSSMSNYSQHEVYYETKKQGITVLIDGQGADEFFLGYNIFRFQFLKESLIKFKLKRTIQYSKNYSRIKQITFFRSLKALILDPLIIIPVLSLFRPKKINLFSVDVNKFLESRNNFVDMKSLIYDQMFRSNLPSLLHSADRNSMMFSIETRLPFLDNKLFEYVSNLPQEYFFKNGLSKYILRDSVESLPLKIKLRSDKMGFESPTKKFVINNSLYIRQQINDVSLKCPFLNKNILDQFDLFLAGNLEYDEVFFRLFTFNRFITIFKIEI